MDHPSSTIIQSSDAGLTRRQLGIAAAWATPLIAVAATAPLAAASPNNAQKTVRVAGNADVDEDGVITGEFTSAQFEYEDSLVGDWPTGAMTATASIGSEPAGMITSAKFGETAGTQWVVGDTITVGNGTLYDPTVTWLVAGVFGTSIRFTAPSVQLYGGPGIVTTIRFPLPKGSAVVEEGAESVMLQYRIQMVHIPTTFGGFELLLN